MSTNTNPLPHDPDELMALAKAIATVLEEKRNDLGIRSDSEGLLHASISAARYAMDRYLAVLYALTNVFPAGPCSSAVIAVLIRSDSRLSGRVY